MSGWCLIVACGNEMAGDDAFGPEVIRTLAQEVLDGVDLVDLGMNPTGLVEQLEGREALVVVDAAVGIEQGTLLECEWDANQRPQLVSERAISTHGMSISSQIELARRLGILPKVVRLVALGSTGASPVPSLEQHGRGARVTAVAEAVRRIKAFVRGLSAAPEHPPGG